jgi:hypothetical protein
MEGLKDDVSTHRLHLVDALSSSDLNCGFTDAFP